MASQSTRVTLTVRDRHQNEARVIFHVAAGIIDPNDATIQAIVAAINACTNSVGIYIELTQVDTLGASATNAAVYVSEDKAVFPALDDNGQPHNFKIPSPKAAIFLADGKSVDFANTLVITFVGAVGTHATGRNQANVIAPSNGYRWASRKALKV